GASYSVALSQTTADGPLQMLQQKLLQAGLLFSGVGSTLLLLGAFMRNRRSRLIRSIMLVGLFAYAAITYQPSLGFCVAFPLLALALFDPRTALKTGTLLKTATGRVFGAAVAALTAAITSSVAFSAKVASTTFDLMARCTRAAGGNLPLFAGIAAAMTALSVALAFTASVHKQQFSLLRITPVRNVQRTNRQPVRTIQPVVPIAPIAGPMIR
ncbi:MAG TPA: hypothetical protein V6C72_17730, partial [Chroococcales cyanobacterium]